MKHTAVSAFEELARVGALRQPPPPPSAEPLVAQKPLVVYLMVDEAMALVVYLLGGLVVW